MTAAHHSGPDPGHMTWWRIAVPALFLAAAVTVVPVSPALACSCAAPRSDAASLQSSDAVFSGELVERHEPGLLEGLGQQSSSVPATFVFAVETVYKGRVARSQGVESARSGASCGLELPQGRRVLVFAETTDDGGLDGRPVRGQPPPRSRRGAVRRRPGPSAWHGGPPGRRRSAPRGGAARGSADPAGT